jgi:hypothetical protein
VALLKGVAVTVSASEFKAAMQRVKALGEKAKTTIRRTFNSKKCAMLRSLDDYPPATKKGISLARSSDTT